MPITGAVEKAGQFGISGWLSRDTPASFAPFVDVIVNRRLAATVPSLPGEPSRYRFSFNPFESLAPGQNSVEVFVSGSDQLIENGAFSIALEPITEQKQEADLPQPSANGELSLGTDICDHCFPSVAGKLTRVYRYLKPGGIAILDFSISEPEMKNSYAAFAENGVFTRIYSEPELRAFILEAGLEILDIAQTGEHQVQVRTRKPEVNV